MLYNQKDQQQVCNNAVTKSAVNIGTFLNSLLLLNKRHMFHPKLTDHTTSFMNVNYVVISHGHSYCSVRSQFSNHRLSGSWLGLLE